MLENILMATPVSSVSEKLRQQALANARQLNVKRNQGLSWEAFACEASALLNWIEQSPGDIDSYQLRLSWVDEVRREVLNVLKADVSSNDECSFSYNGRVRVLVFRDGVWQSR